MKCRFMAARDTERFGQKSATGRRYEILLRRAKNGEALLHTCTLIRLTASVIGYHGKVSTVKCHGKKSLVWEEMV